MRNVARFAINTFAPISESPPGEPLTSVDKVVLLWSTLVSSGAIAALISWLASIPLDSKPALYIFLVQSLIWVLKTEASMVQNGPKP